MLYGLYGLPFDISGESEVAKQPLERPLEWG
jgi:hypothetical protein